MWERLARAGIPYTRPQGRPPRSPRALRRFLDPLNRLRGVRLSSARVLVLASGGGWDAELFARLAANVTLLDISARQLATVRRLARAAGVRVRCVLGNMKDLSRFAPGSFDVVWHLHSLVFVDDARRVLRQVGRVLAPGGTYVMSTMHPAAMRLYGTYARSGWHPRSYFGIRPLRWDGVWRFGRRRVVAPTIEFAHRIDTIVNGMAAGGMMVDGLWELRPEVLDPAQRKKRRPVTPGSDAHVEALVPAHLQIRARKVKVL